MPNGNLRDYYWRIVAFLAGCWEFLDARHSAFQFPSDGEVEHTGALNATIVFWNGARLYTRASLDERAAAAIREYDYAYIYYDRRGKRIFQYDDAPHHPGLSTHPHHLHLGAKLERGPERVHPTDIPRAEFIAVVEKIIEQIERSE